MNKSGSTPVYDPFLEKDTILTATLRPVIALVPAHNEQDTIVRTVTSLLNQTYELKEIIVILDNCTDNTEKFVKEIQKANTGRGPQLKVISTVGNDAKKAGALNYGISLVEDNSNCIIVQMDADTVLEPDIIEMGMKEFERSLRIPNQKLGGVCSRFLVADPISKMNWLGWLLWNLQNIEYGFADADRVILLSQQQDARVLSGTCSMYPKYVLDEVAKMRPLYHGLPQIWDVHSLVEDYTLTNDVRSLGYITKCPYNMVNLTNIPESFREYWRQRERWYSGTIDELRRRGLKKYTAADISLHAFGVLMTITRIVFYSLIIYLIVNHTSFEPNVLTYITPLVVYAYNIHRFKYIRVNRSWVQAVLVFTLIPMEAYALLRECLMVKSYYLSFFGKKRGW
jgi:poly-beta-1,6-N-acetyl-D-glucosamine synthase